MLLATRCYVARKADVERQSSFENLWALYLQRRTLRYVTLHTYITLRYITLSYVTLRYIKLH